MTPPEDNNKEDRLIVYFMGQTNERLVQIENKLLELIAFRAEVLAHAKSTAIWVGIICSLLSIVLNVLLRKVGL